MTTYEAMQKQGWMEYFNTVVALYFILKSNSASFRVKPAVIRDGEVEAQPMDFIFDVEIKTKRALGQPFFDLFLRAVANEQTEILPEYMRESLGKYWKSYGLTPEGSYAKLYFDIKNKQDRSVLKLKREDIQNDTGAGISANEYSDDSSQPAGV
jgi:hypothetical protein